MLTTAKAATDCSILIVALISLKLKVITIDDLCAFKI